VDKYLNDRIPPQAYQEAIESNKKELQRTQKGGAVLTDQAWTELAVARFRKQMASQLNLLSFGHFAKAEDWRTGKPDANCRAA
jgi:hypothetical protein